MKNIFSSLPDGLEHESLEELLRHENIKIERIVSQGHTSSENGWYDQKAPDQFSSKAVSKLI